MFEPVSESGSSDDGDYNDLSSDNGSSEDDDKDQKLLIDQVVESDDGDDEDSEFEDPEVEDDATDEVLWKGDRSLKELMILREKIGLKKFNKEILNSDKSNPPNQKQKRKNKVFKRECRRRPQEMSSKIRVPFLRQVVKTKKFQPRDPRFDDLCGSHFSKEKFDKRYAFLDDIRERERAELRKTLKQTENPDEKDKLKYLLRRMKQQSQAKEYNAIMKQVEEEYKKDEIAKVEQGIKKPFYLPKKKRKELFQKKKLELQQQRGNWKKLEINKEKKLKRKEMKHMPRKRRTEE